MFFSSMTVPIAASFPALDERISDDQLTTWVSTYLRRKDEIQGLNPNTVNEAEIDLWCISTRIMEVVSLVQSSMNYKVSTRTR